MKKNWFLIVIAVGLAALSLGACASSSADLQGTEWQWVSLTESNPPSQSINPDAESYTITFTDGENVSIKADCNMVMGTYSTSGAKMTIETGPSTLAYCGDESQDAFFLGLIAQVVSYEVVDGSLELALANEAGTMSFIDAATDVGYLPGEDDLWVDLPEDADGAILTADVNVNVRSGPGMQFRVVAIAMQGDQGRTVGSSPDDAWWAIPLPPEYPENEMAWVAKSVTTMSNPDNVDLPTITPPLMNTVYVNPPAEGDPQGKVLERAEVYTGPGKKYQLVGLTSTGADVKILGSTADESWWLIEIPVSFLPAGQAWIADGYLETSNVGSVKEITDIPAVDEQARPTASGMSAAAARMLETVAVRSGPGEDYNAFMEAEAGTILGIVGISSDEQWWVVNLPRSVTPDKQGWIPMDATESSKSDAPSPYIPVVNR